MFPEYSVAKFIHILVAILALGTSAGLGIVLEFYGDDPTHGSFVLRASERIEVLFVIPGYVLMLVSGIWMVHLSWPLTAKWIHVALTLWGVGMVLLGISLAVLHKKIKLFDAEGSGSPSYRKISLLGRGLGAGAGLVVVFILYVMVFKLVIIKG